MYVAHRFFHDGPAMVLLLPQLPDEGLFAWMNVVQRNHIVLGDIPAKHAAFRQTDRKRPNLASRRPVFDEPIGAEASNPVEALARFQITLRNGDNFANRPANGSECSATG